MNNNRLNINFLGKELKTPVITSSGCFGFGEEYNDYFDVNELGAVNLKGITLNKRDGNSGVRIAETPSGMINCIGLENPGIEYFRDEIIKNIKYSTPIILNINGSTLEEYVKVAEIANEIDRVDFIELNISCPNVKNGGMAFGASCESAEKTTKEVKKVLTKKPLIVKLSPNVTDIVSIAKSVEYAGADSVSLVNTFLAMKIDIKTKKPLLGNIFGGLSGAAIMPIALRMVYQVYKAINIPIVGMGGIQKYEDALEFIMAGASIVSIGSGIFSNPTLPIEIIKQINNYLEENNINNIKDLIGVAHL
ncbi:dihydroorotate dehydrogenase [uncultured Brachyspira sp.]|uniref:dihydroorotate dehydrogenase n=1 Tax=uncultured Brachyspira sp. TaxID=221953 RepID=UPI002600AE6E|nr:dihydroorotate dehydrogenase [uncultured Brachyspira sp.]